MIENLFNFLTFEHSVLLVFKTFRTRHNLSLAINTHDQIILNLVMNIFTSSFLFHNFLIFHQRLEKSNHFNLVDGQKRHQMSFQINRFNLFTWRDFDVTRVGKSVLEIVVICWQEFSDLGLVEGVAFGGEEGRDVGKLWWENVSSSTACVVYVAEGLFVDREWDYMCGRLLGIHLEVHWCCVF